MLGSSVVVRKTSAVGELSVATGAFSAAVVESVFFPGMMVDAVVKCFEVVVLPVLEVVEGSSVVVVVGTSVVVDTSMLLTSFEALVM